MLRDNQTPFAALAFEQTHRNGARMAVVVARARFDLFPDGSLARAEKQFLVLADVYDGPPTTSPLIDVSDLAPFKPFADVTVIGDAYAPNGVASRQWTAGVKIGERRALIRVNGPRKWEPISKSGAGRWRLAEAALTAQAPSDYRYAAGGRIIGHPRGEADHDNPIGAGVLDPAVTSPFFAYDAPQIDSEQAPIVDAFARPAPQGLGPVAPVWGPRLRYAGTYDDAWRALDPPRPPDDHDYRFWQVAPPQLQLPGYLRAGEIIRLGRLARDAETVDFYIPDVEPWAHFRWIDGRDVFARMNRDGLHIDMRGDAPWRVDLTFRCWLEICPRFYCVDLALTDARGAAPLPFAREDGLAEASA